LFPVRLSSPCPHCLLLLGAQTSLVSSAHMCFSKCRYSLTRWPSGSFVFPSIFMLCFLRDEGGQMTCDGLQVLLGFSLACGHVSNMLQCLQCLQQNPEMEIECVPLLRSLNSVRDSYLRRYGEGLFFIVSCLDFIHCANRFTCDPAVGGL
jgi:hypothetical protein